MVYGGRIRLLKALAKEEGEETSAFEMVSALHKKI